MDGLLIFVETATIEKIFILGFLSFVLTMALTPIYTTAAYAGQWWKKVRVTTMTGEAAKVYTKLHASKHARHIPTMAGIVFVTAVALVTLAGNLSRSETWLPFAAIVWAGAIGLFFFGSGAGLF